MSQIFRIYNRPTMQKAAWAFAVMCALLAGIRAVWIGFGTDLANADYRYIWVAGDLWIHGLDPYGPKFAMRPLHEVARSEPLLVWMYPPHWFAIAVPFAIAPFWWSYRIWLACFTALFAGATVWAWKALTPLSPPWWLAFALTTTAVTSALTTGQPVMPAYIGICLLILGLARKNHIITAVGVFLALLKLQLGVPFVILLLLMDESRRGTIFGLFAAVLGSLPSFYIGGLHGGFFHATLNRSAYTSMDYNTPMQMNGVTHALARSAGMVVPIDVSLLLGTVAAVGLFFFSRREKLETFVLGGVCSTVLIIGIHTYDLIVTLLLIPYVSRLNNWQRFSTITGFLLLWRPENLARFFKSGATPVIVADITTVATLLICLPFLLRLVSRGSDVSRAPVDFSPART